MSPLPEVRTSLEGRIRAAILVLAVVLLATTALPELIWTVRINAALVQTTKQIGDRYPALRISELLGEAAYSKPDGDKGHLRELERLASKHPTPGIQRFLGIAFAVLGENQLADMYLRQTGSNRLALMARAIVYGRERRYEDMQEILRTLPGAAATLAANGHSAYWAEHHDEAKSLLEMALALDFHRDLKRASIYQELGLIYGLSGDLANGIRYAQLWSETSPDDLNAAMTLAAFYVQQGRAEEAYAALQQSELGATQQHALYGIVLARIYDLRGDLAQAISLYRNELQKNPVDPYLNWYLGATLYRFGDPEQALPFLEVAMRSSVPTLQQAAGLLIEQIQLDQPARP